MRGRLVSRPRFLWVYGLHTVFGKCVGYEKTVAESVMDLQPFFYRV